MKYVFIDPLYEAHIHRSNQISFRNMERIAQKKDIEEMKKLEVFRHKCKNLFLERDIDYTTVFVYIEFFEKHGPFLWLSKETELIPLNNMNPFFNWAKRLYRYLWKAWTLSLIEQRVQTWLVLHEWDFIYSNSCKILNRKEQCCNPLSQLVVVLSFFQKSVKMIGASEFPDGKYLIVCVLF